ncbi:LysR family transcriptional regulator [Terribacillus saccharophilus]|uniref:LysR family transcriptional regulator n=1 Tax=Terribacillus saccharophilus TaxID=361277 RepID=UPI000C9AED1B|nr:LysR family transcriptional regulator [Terribacillus goriensis]MEC0283341.1 LysR family transcriptional regulator [Terribacillus saccharophilus]MEC0290297.1 LysR family transcriptional regulator [Terribacillus saccharophilus]
MELRQLRYFIEVAQREHMSEAAEYLHVAQSAISRQISNLEDELGVDLFEREGRNVKLTKIGRTFLSHIETAMQAIDYAKKQIDEHLDPERGSIKIGFPTSLAGQLLPTVIYSFKEAYPNIQFQLRQGTYQFLIEQVSRGDIDIAFIGPVPRDHDRIEGEILFTESFSALVPVAHRFAEREQLHLKDLQSEQFVLFPEGYKLRQLVMDGCKKAGFEPTVSSEGEDLDAIKGLVAAGIGITILPESTFYDATPRMTTKIPITFPEVRRSVGVIIPKERQVAPSERLFYEFVRDFFSRLQQFR